jgi:hypothetical protein
MTVVASSRTHKHYERNLVLWLAVVYTLIGLLTAALIV